MMNANELADALDDIAQNSTRIHVHIKEHLTKAATILRQLQAENEMLKAAKIKSYDNGYEDGRKASTTSYSCGIGCEYPTCNCWREE